MSDTTLGLIVLGVPVAGIALLIPATRRLLRGIVRLIGFTLAVLGIGLGFTLAVLGIGLVGGEPKRMLMTSLVKHGTDPDRPGRHAAPGDTEPEPDHGYLDTAPDNVPAPVPVRPGLEPYSPQWYEFIYD